MHAKTMEGLAGASMSMKLMNTPIRVYKEAERRGTQPSWNGQWGMSVTLQIRRGLPEDN